MNVRREGVKKLSKIMYIRVAQMENVITHEGNDEDQNATAKRRV